MGSRLGREAYGLPAYGGMYDPYYGMDYYGGSYDPYGYGVGYPTGGYGTGYFTTSVVPASPLVGPPASFGLGASLLPKVRAVFIPQGGMGAMPCSGVMPMCGGFGMGIGMPMPMSMPMPAPMPVPMSMPMAAPIPMGAYTGFSGLGAYGGGMSASGFSGFGSALPMIGGIGGLASYGGFASGYSAAGFGGVFPGGFSAVSPLFGAPLGGMASMGMARSLGAIGAPMMQPYHLLQAAPVPVPVPQPYPVAQPVPVPQPVAVPQPVPVLQPVSVPQPVPVPQLVPQPVPVPVPVAVPQPVAPLPMFVAPHQQFVPFGQYGVAGGTGRMMCCCFPSAP